MAARRSSICAWLLAASACAVEPDVRPPAAGAPEPTPVEAARAPVDPALERLAQLAVYNDDFARAELYTWTTLEQLRRVRDTRQLLQADASTGGRASPFNRALMAIPQDGSESAQLAALLLEHPALHRRRYAWPSPFATTMGLGSRRYGDSLIRIELDERALIGRFEPDATPPFSFVDLQGQPTTPAAALAEPERIAAIYHLRGPPEFAVAFREYVVCSEAMIRAWSIATPEIRARVDEELELLGLLRRRTLAGLPRAAVREPAVGDWASASLPATPLSLWHASLAFDNHRYRPSPANLEAIRATLAGYEHDGGPPLVHRPNAEPANAQPEAASPGWHGSGFLRSAEGGGGGDA